ncbi:PREDICTED: ankyrin repeat-containing protein At5g02620 [Tarenaya hassleriana]|uniref:ankyrin repeat-containing protein At5g02620 n=1 Tax=Tarenaya hassleriana TaxID=28532 RepID=UPI00053C1DD0|nr:PREDICTED: ankyrin repeat-containing protein At5g02620 [Tarenaya hassleriana]
MEAGVFDDSSLIEERPLNPLRSAYAREPDLVYELDNDGFTPLHKAASAGQAEIVRGILGIDGGLCRLKGGREGETPLHVAAVKGKVDAIREMVRSCADCVEDTTVQGQTALHLAVQHHRYEAVDAMVEMIRESKRGNVLNMKDEQGNTPLHLATWRKQRRVIETLLQAKPEEETSYRSEVNAVNKMGLAALDLLLMFPSEAGDREIYEILIKAGARRGKEHAITISTTNPTCQEPTHEDDDDDLVEYFSFKRCRDSPSEARSALLVVASLVATATFQASLSPPGGTWQDSYLGSGLQNKTAIDDKPHKAGKSIMGTFEGVSFTLFVFFNTIGFSVSLAMIEILTRGFPLHFNLRVCMVAMFFSQNASMNSIAPDHVKLYCIIITSVISAASPFLTKLLEQPVRKLVKLVCFIFRKMF